MYPATIEEHGDWVTKKWGFQVSSLFILVEIREKGITASRPTVNGLSKPT